MNYTIQLTIKNCLFLLDVVCHRFPNPRNDLARFSEWIRMVGLVDINPEVVYKNKFICAKHFNEDCSSPGIKRLKINSMPTLSLPSKLFFIN